MTNPNDEVGLMIPQKNFAPRKTFILAAANDRFPPFWSIQSKQCGALLPVWPIVWRS
ncbi:MAG: hypothetical protein V9G18_11450 [Albidovulum sp.]|jgi:hypothetical protein